MGNSAMDIAVERSYVARKTYLASRRGAYVIPKYVFGRPLDQIGVNSLTPLLPFAFRRAILMAMYHVGVGKVQDYGLPEPVTGSARRTRRSRRTSSTGSRTAT